MPIVQLPDGRRLNFPDGMSSTDMSNAIRQNFPEIFPTEPTGIGGVLGDIGQGIADVPGAVFNIAKNLPSELYGAGKQALTEPGRAAKNVLAGTAELGRGMLNAPSTTAKYLSKRGFIKPETAESIPRKGEFDYREALGIEGQKPGDVLLGALPETPYWMATGGTGLLGKGAFQASKFGGLGAVTEQNPVTLGLIPPAIEGVAKGGAATIKGVGKAVKAGKMATKPTEAMADIAAKMSQATPEELAANARAAEGTQTPLGDVIKSPKLKKLYETILQEAPFSNVEQQLGEIGKQVSDKGEKTLKSLGSLEDFAREVDLNYKVKSVLSKAAETERRKKNELYNNSDKLIKKENIKLELPKFRDLLIENKDALLKSPLIESDKRFKDLLGKVEGAEKGIKKELTLGNVKALANTFTDAAKILNKSATGSDKFLGNLYERLGNTAKEELNKIIYGKGSKALRDEYKKAEENFRENYAPYLEQSINKLIKSELDAENIVREIIKPSRVQDSAARIRQVQDLLPEGNENLLGFTYLKRAIDKNGNFKFNEMRNLIKGLGPRQFEALFPNKNVNRALKDIEKLAELNTEALNIMFNPKTGFRIGKLLNALTTLVTIGGGLFLSPAKALTEIGLFAGSIAGAKHLSNLMIDPIFRELVIKKIKLKNKNVSPQMKKDIDSKLESMLKTAIDKDLAKAAPVLNKEEQDNE